MGRNGGKGDEDMTRIGERIGTLMGLGLLLGALQACESDEAE
jgi:hypothetical protein